MYKKILVLCLLALTFGIYGFSPGCGFPTKARYEVGTNTTNGDADIEYIDKNGDSQKITTHIPWFYEFSDIPHDLYLHVTNLTRPNATANAAIVIDDEIVKYCIYNDTNKPCNMTLTH